MILYTELLNKIGNKLKQPCKILSLELSFSINNNHDYYIDTYLKNRLIYLGAFEITLDGSELIKISYKDFIFIKRLFTEKLFINSDNRLTKDFNKNKIKIVKYYISNFPVYTGYLTCDYYTTFHKNNLKLFKFITKEFCGNIKPVSDIYGETIDSVKYIIKKKLNRNNRILHEYTDDGNLEIVKYLVKKGYEYNSKKIIRDDNYKIRNYLDTLEGKYPSNASIGLKCIECIDQKLVKGLLCLLFLIIGTLFLGVLYPLKYFNFDLLQYFEQIWARCILWILNIKIKVKNIDNLSDKEPSIILSNHRSLLDCVILTAAGAKCKFVMKKEIFYSFPLIGLLAVLYGHVTIDRSNNEKSVKILKDFAAKNKFNRTNIGIFPEGKRNHRFLGEFKKGAFHMSKDYNINIVPTLITGSGELLPPHCFIPCKGIIEVNFLKVIKPLQHENSNELLKESRKEILSEIKRKGTDITNYFENPPKSNRRDFCYSVPMTMILVLLYMFIIYLFCCIFMGRIILIKLEI